MKKIFLYFLLLLPFLGFAQTPKTDAATTTQINSKIRTKSFDNINSADAFETLNQSKVNINNNQTVIAAGTNTYTVSLTPPITAYTFNQKVYVYFSNANSGSSTLNIDGLGAITIKKKGTSTLVDVDAGDIIPGIYPLAYDGTYFEILLGGGSGGGSSPDASPTVKGIAKLYTSSGSNTDGSIDQNTITSALAGKQASGSYAVTTNNLSDLASATTARTNLGLGTLATQSGTFSGTSSGTNTGDQTLPTTLPPNGAAGGDLTGTYPNPTFSISGVSAGTYGSATQSIILGLDAKGRAISASLVSITAPILQTPRSIYGNNFDGSAALAQIIASTFGGTGNGFTKFSGPTTSEKTFTLPNVSAAILTDNALVSVAQGGTGVNTSSGASSIVLRDANQNIAVNNTQLGYTTTATGAGTTTLTVSSSRNQYFTGTTTQTVLMPVVSTLPLGHIFSVVNNSTGVVTVQSSGANSIQLMAAGSTMELKSISTSGTTASSWSWEYHPINPMTSAEDLIKGGSSGEPARLGIGTERQILSVVGSVVTWGTGIVGTITNDNAIALSVGEFSSSLIAVGSATSLTTATAKNVTSISLTAGDWDVAGNINFTEGSATVTTRTAGISSTSATQPTDGSEVEMGITTTVLSTKIGIAVPRKRFSLSSTTTIYLVATSTFSAGTSAAYGSITARRVR